MAPSNLFEGGDIPLCLSGPPTRQTLINVSKNAVVGLDTYNQQLLIRTIPFSAQLSREGSTPKLIWGDRADCWVIPA